MDTKLFREANLVIIDGMVMKNRWGPSGRKAEVGDFERANVVIKNGEIIKNSGN